MHFCQKHAGFLVCCKDSYAFNAPTNKGVIECLFEGRNEILELVGHQGSNENKGVPFRFVFLAWER